MTTFQCLQCIAPAAFVVIVLGQAEAPRLRTSTEISEASEDQMVMDRVAMLPDFDAYLSDADSVITFPLARGGDLLELFRIADGSVDRTLHHVSPVVRAYAAYHLMRVRPATARRLKPLLTDDEPLLHLSHGDSPRHTSVGTLVLELLCARAGEPPVTSILNELARDPRRIALWPAARRCIVRSEPSTMTMEPATNGLIRATSQCRRRAQHGQVNPAFAVHVRVRPRPGQAAAM